jgi:transposase-like protein
MTNKKSSPKKPRPEMPSVERVQKALATVESMDDFFGKNGIFAELFSETMEQMLEAELTEELGYEPYEVEGRNSGNSRNGHYEKKLRTSVGETRVRVPRDRNGDFDPKLIKKYASNTNELEDKILALYAKGQSTRDIRSMLAELYGMDISDRTVSAVTEKIWPVVEAWQNRPLAAVYAIVYLDAIHMKIRREGRVQNTAVYNVLAVGLDGQKDILGHWVGDGGEGANFWLSVLTDLQSRGVQDILIASIDGLTGFDSAIRSVFPATRIQSCVIHQIRTSLRYVTWKDRKAFVADLKRIYRAPTLEQAETELEALAETWTERYPMAVRTWQANWDRLATYFDFPEEIRRLIYTTNSVEAYNRQLRKVTKTKSSFPTPEAARKLLYLATRDITNKWTRPLQHWSKILNQLAIRFEDRIPA